MMECWNVRLSNFPLETLAWTMNLDIPNMSQKLVRQLTHVCFYLMLLHGDTQPVKLCSAGPGHRIK